MAKYKEIATKLIKEKIKNEKIREENNELKSKNLYLSSTSNELMGILDNFIEATSHESQVSLLNTGITKGYMGKTSHLNPSHTFMIDSQFKNLEDYAKGYNVLKTCFETTSIFREKIDKFKAKTHFGQS